MRYHFRAKGMKPSEYHSVGDALGSDKTRIERSDDTGVEKDEAAMRIRKICAESCKAAKIGIPAL